MQYSVPFSDSGSVVAVQSHGVNFVNKCNGSVLVGNVQELLQRANSSCHGMYRLKCHNFGGALVHLFQKAAQMVHIVVPEYVLGHTTIPNPHDHGSVVACVREYLAARQQPGKSKERRIVGHKARREQQSGLLLMQLRQLAFQAFVVQRVARNIPGASGSRTVHVEGLLDGSLDARMGRHAQVVVGTPDRNRLLGPLRIFECMREQPVTSQAVHLLEDAIGVVLLLLLDLLIEELLIGKGLRGGGGLGGAGRHLSRVGSPETIALRRIRPCNS